MSAKENYSEIENSIRQCFKVFHIIFCAICAPLTQNSLRLMSIFALTFKKNAKIDDRKHGVIYNYGSQKNVGGCHPPGRNSYSSNKWQSIR